MSQNDTALKVRTEQLISVTILVGPQNFPQGISVSAVKSPAEINKVDD
jgi:hypothetical protein